MRKLLTLAIATVGLAACTTVTTSNPARTATEELLISKAAEQAADNMKFDVPPGTKLFLDATYFDGYDSKYAIGTIRDRLIRRGAHLVDKKDDAQVVLEIRSGALSIDEHSVLVGIPGFNIPIPLAGGLGFPEIALYKKAVRAGVAKFAATGYDAKTGTLVSTTDPQFGFSQKTKKVVMIFFDSSINDTVPPGAPVEGAPDAPSGN
jgi:hypothetical protein